MTDANITRGVATATVAAAVETAGAQAAAPAAAPAVATRQTAMTKGFAFLSEIGKLEAAASARVLEDLGLMDATEKKHPFAIGFGAGVIVTALVLLVLFGIFGHH